MIPIILCAALAVSMVHAVLTAPVGYEDEEGFHFG